MAIFDIYSKRQKKINGDVPDVYIYDLIPTALRTQIVHIWHDTLGDQNQYVSMSTVRDVYTEIVNILRREYGVFSLKGPDEPYDDLKSFILNENQADRVLDAIELSFNAINICTRDRTYLGKPNPDKIANEAISELNTRFKEHGIGYEFIDGKIVRIDSQLIHSEVVKPALILLHEKDFTGPQEEFMKAYEHYRKGNAKEALNECLKSFESVMKVICGKRGWQYDPHATARTLIQICFDNSLIPLFWQQQYNSLRSLLESSVPTGRNNLGGHGQGATPISVPDYLVAYMLHMTASAIVFLVEANNKLV